MPRSEFSSETALKRYLKPRSFLQTASLANEIVCVLNGAKLKALKRDLKAKAKYLVETAELSRSKTSCAVLAEQCGDLYTALAFAESRHGDRPDKREKYDLRGLKTEAELEAAIERAKKILNTRVISPRLLRAAKDRMTENSRLIARHGHNEYFSPPPLVEAARKTMGGIDCDPASNKFAQKWIKAKRWFGLKEDGLKQKWKGRVWLNPPYNGKGVLASFIEKFCVEAEKGVCLVNNNTETRWGQRLLAEANALCFPAGRLCFYDKGGERKQSAIQGSMIAGVRVNTKKFCKAFSRFGQAVGWHK